VFDVPVRVAYGTDPERVIKLLVAVAESYPGVLLDRPPMALLPMGFGESALNFELRFWVCLADSWFQLQSDVTVAFAKGPCARLASKSPFLNEIASVAR